MRSTILCLCGFAVSTLSAAPYAVTSPYLQDPDAILPYVTASADFWLKTQDEEFGGFFTFVGPDGTPILTPPGTLSDFLGVGNKGGMTQSRVAYGLVRAFMVSGDTRYLDAAKDALLFLDNYWDPAGGWWSYVKRDGTGRRGAWNGDGTMRSALWHHYFLLGPITFFEATRDPEIGAIFEKGYAWNDQYLWDHRPGLKGYFNETNLDGSNGRVKNFTSIGDAVTTHAITTYQISRAADRRQRLLDLYDVILNRFVATQDIGSVKAGFRTDFNADWVYSGGSIQGSIGHFLKTAWQLGRAYLLDDNPLYVSRANQILVDMWVPIPGTTFRSFFDNGQPKASVLLSTGRASGEGNHWETEQAFTGGLINWFISRDDRWLEMADKSLKFYMTYYWDPVNGEVFEKVNNAGVPMADELNDDNTPAFLKGDMFKSGYHNIEMLYLAYIYGNLFLRNRSVTLYYSFAPTDSQRVFNLFADVYEENRLIVSAIEKDGDPAEGFQPVEYTQFDGNARTITLPPGEGGIYRVTYESVTGFNPKPRLNGWMSGPQGDINFAPSRNYRSYYHLMLGWLIPVTIDKDTPDHGNWHYSPRWGFLYLDDAHKDQVYRPGRGWQPTTLFFRR